MSIQYCCVRAILCLCLYKCCVRTSAVLLNAIACTYKKGSFYPFQDLLVLGITMVGMGMAIPMSVLWPRLLLVVVTQHGTSSTSSTSNTSTARLISSHFLEVACLGFDSTLC